MFLHCLMMGCIMLAGWITDTFQCHDGVDALGTVQAVSGKAISMEECAMSCDAIKPSCQLFTLLTVPSQSGYVCILKNNIFNGTGGTFVQSGLAHKTCVLKGE